MIYPAVDFVEVNGKRKDKWLFETVEEAEAATKQLKFPPTFAFGAATAAYQTEGGIVDTNWNRWEALGKRPHDGGETIARGETAKVACDSWNRFEDDLKVLCDLGLSVYRFSVEWSRVEPSEGKFDEAAINRYAHWCKSLRAKGIEVCCATYHPHYAGHARSTIHSGTLIR